MPVLETVQEEVVGTLLTVCDQFSYNEKKKMADANQRTQQDMGERHAFITKGYKVGPFFTRPPTRPPDVIGSFHTRADGLKPTPNEVKNMWRHGEQFVCIGAGLIRCYEPSQVEEGRFTTKWVRDNLADLDGKRRSFEAKMRQRHGEYTVKDILERAEGADIYQSYKALDASIAGALDRMMTKCII